MAAVTLSRADVRSLDARASEWGLPTVVLMENAGRGAACVLREYAERISRVVVICGPGNNGGDGAVLARYCDLWGYSVSLFWVGWRSTPNPLVSTQRAILDHSGLVQHDLSGADSSTAIGMLFAEADWVVDGLFGTGLTRPVDGTPRAIIEAMNASTKPILSLDIPSGLESDSGLPLGTAVRATHTATFVAPKKGFSTPGADSYTGQITVVDIGIPRRLLEMYAVRGRC